MATKLPATLGNDALQTYLNHAEMRTQLVNQIEKDLGLEPIPIDVNADNFFLLLEAALREVLLKCIQNKPEALAHLIYRVDLPENETRHMLATTNQPANYLLAAAILKREMKKVVIRNIYNGTLKI
jgi:hypothetical protein